MRIDRALNLVIPIYGEPTVRTTPRLVDGKTVLGPDGKPIVDQVRENGQPVFDEHVDAYVHAVPLGEDTVKRYFMVLAQTYAAIMSQGLGIASGPAVAAMLLEQIAVNTGQWDGPDGVKNGLMAEINRTTTTIVPTETGWQPVPLETAADRKMLSPEDLKEVRNAIVFFIAVSAVLSRSMRRQMMEMASGLWGGQTSSLDSTAFIASLTTSTGTASSGEKAPAAKPAADNATVDGQPSSVPV